MNTTSQKPTIGRIVFFWFNDVTPNPAIVTAVDPDGLVDLHVFGDLPMGVDSPIGRGVRESAGGGTDTWSWPPRT